MDQLYDETLLCISGKAWWKKGLNLVCFDSLGFDVIIARFFFWPIVDDNFITGLKCMDLIERNLFCTSGFNTVFIRWDRRPLDNSRHTCFHNKIVDRMIKIIADVEIFDFNRNDNILCVQIRNTVGTTGKYKDEKKRDEYERFSHDFLSLWSR